MLLPSTRSGSYGQTTKREATAMLFSSKPYLQPEPAATIEEQHVKAFCGKTLPIGLHSKPDHSGSLPPVLLEHFQSRANRQMAAKNAAGYSALAIVALNARGLSVREIFSCRFRAS